MASKMWQKAKPNEADEDGEVKNMKSDQIKQPITLLHTK